MTSSRNSSSRASAGQLRTLQALLCARVEEVFAALGARMTRNGRHFAGPCPCHGGDNAGACTLYPEGDHNPGYWRCYTAGCHKALQPTILGLIRGALSRRELGWSPGQAPVPFAQAVEWACGFLGVRPDELHEAAGDLDRARFARAVEALTAGRQRPSGRLTREQARGRLRVPSPYFLSRGFTAEVLDRYDVGDCLQPDKPFFSRAVVPVYDDAHLRAVGFVARSTLPQCPLCGLWHPRGPCPDTLKKKSLCTKWRNSHAFPRESHLYNWWSAHKAIDALGVACLVEGPGEVWRLEEAGVKVGLALFGNELSDEQQVLLERSGAMTVIGLLNNDEAGRLGHARLKEQLGGLYNLTFPPLPGNDLGEMTPAAVAELLGPLIERHRRRTA